ncbi:MAG: TonB-dependent receptor domain-containing protein [Planctomycetota bacterium]
MSDLTSFDVTSAVETPAPNLQPEHFVTFETGVKTAQSNVSGSAALWYTILDGTIVRSPTGEVIDDTPVVRKDNVGDGWMWGWEVEAAWRLRPAWTAFGNASWMEGQVDQIDPDTGRLVRSWLSRQKPFTLLAGLRYEPPRGRGWAQVDVSFSARADRLSLRDRTDTSRIPPDGTPGWTNVALRGGWRVGDDVRLGLSLENLLDENYRIHGSGQNEPGLNVVFTCDLDM